MKMLFGPAHNIVKKSDGSPLESFWEVHCSFACSSPAGGMLFGVSGLLLLLLVHCGIRAGILAGLGAPMGGREQES